MRSNLNQSHPLTHNLSTLDSNLSFQATVSSLQTAFAQKTSWKTNLMINSQVQRIKQRSLLFRKRTSFEEHVINDHLKQMRKVLLLTGLQLKKIDLPVNDKVFHQKKQSKKIQQLENNIYLTEEEKWEFTELFLSNQQNFSIFLRMSYIFLENKEQLIYLLSHILNFVSGSIISKNGLHNKKQTLKDIVDNNRLKLIEAVLNQPNIKNISPVFFSNHNQKPLMEIINNWLYNVLCIKHGVYDSHNIDTEEGEMQGEQIQSEEEDLFD